MLTTSSVYIALAKVPDLDNGCPRGFGLTVVLLYDVFMLNNETIIINIWGNFIKINSSELNAYNHFNTNIFCVSIILFQIIVFM